MFKQRKPYHSPHTHHADFSETKQIIIWMENIYFISLSFTIFSVLSENYLSWLAGLFYPVDLWSWWSRGAVELSLETKKLGGRRALNYCRVLSRPGNISMD